jgi:hypothetical protein
MSTTPPPSSRPSGVAIGISDFRKLRESGSQYVDKTEFIAGVLEAKAEVLLFPRPRRFGKTTNLSTLRCFVAKTDEDVRPLFAGLAIEQQQDAWAHFQRYPVIYMTFKDAKAPTFDLALAALRQEIRSAYREHRYLLDSAVLDEEERARFRQILRQEGDEAIYWRSLQELSAYLHRHHGEKVAILIDEYDTPIHAGFGAGYYDRIIVFFRNFLSGGLKDNPHLWKGVLTGILRVARESIFSGLNNLAVYSVLRPAFSTSFGFTPEEVERLAREIGCEAAIPDMERWYNGYRFGDAVVYNPWSVLNFLGSEDRVLRPYWIASGSQEIIRDILLSRAGDPDGELEMLLRGKSITKLIDENVSLRDLPPGADVVWGFLLFTGYLTATRVRQKGGLVEVRLKIPNREVRAAYRSVFRTWLSLGLGDGKRVQKLVDAILAGDAEECERLLEDLLLHSLSVHDTGRGPGEPERVYHAFVLGLLVSVGPRYRVWSNRESGHGRCDVMILRKGAGQAGAVLELKVVDKRRGETPARAMKAALRQVREKDYAAELRAAGAGVVREMGVVFDGKRVRVCLCLAFAAARS